MGVLCFLVQKCMPGTKVPCFSVNFSFVLGSSLKYIHGLEGVIPTRNNFGNVIFLKSDENCIFCTEFQVPTFDFPIFADLFIKKEIGLRIMHFKPLNHGLLPLKLYMFGI